MRFSRGDTTELPGFDENMYVRNSAFNCYEWFDLIDEFESLRDANLLMFKNMPTDAWLHSGVASGHSITVRALAYVMVGHVRHHAQIIDTRLKGKTVAKTV